MIFCNMTFFVLSKVVSRIFKAAFATSTSRSAYLKRTLDGSYRITLISEKKAQSELVSCFASNLWCRVMFCRA